VPGHLVSIARSPRASAAMCLSRRSGALSRLCESFGSSSFQANRRLQATAMRINRQKPGKKAAYPSRRMNRCVRIAPAIVQANSAAAIAEVLKKSRAMEQIYSRNTEQARHQYTLASVPRGNNLGSNYHRMELHVEGDGLTVPTLTCTCGEGLHTSHMNSLTTPAT
jgi:hypothetical protein